MMILVPNLIFVYPSTLQVAWYSNLQINDQEHFDISDDFEMFNVRSHIFIIVRRGLYIILMVIVFTCLIRLTKKNHNSQFRKHKFNIILYFSIVMIFSICSFILTDIFGYMIAKDEYKWENE